MKVAVLGCGPAGLIAAHAAVELGHHVSVFSHKLKSRTFGAMYLHKPIHGVSPPEPEMEITVVKLGSREGYAANVYGDPHADVSWDKFSNGPTPGWDLAATYEKLWEMYEGIIVNKTLSPPVIRSIEMRYDTVFSTIPAKMLCEVWEHDFESQQIWVLHGPADEESNANVMYYNGLPLTGFGGWYRYSNIRGYQSWEYSPKQIPRYVEGQAVMRGLQIIDGLKPLRTNCDCRPGIVRLGRFGKWDKHTFTHHSYTEVWDVLYKMR